MTEFDDQAFSAIDKFFGDGEATADDSKTSNNAAVRAHHVQHLSRKDHRCGVGAAQTKTSPSDLNLQKRILQVGRKRGLQQQSEEDEINHSDSDSANQEDEEQGRTSISESLKKKDSNVAKFDQAPTLGKKKKKRKTNKKPDQESTDTPGVVAEVNEEEPIDSLGLVIDREGVDPETLQENCEKPPTVEQPRRRKKIRSRQKNIVKDKREKKPEHLIPGSKNYSGRPITLETRQKLGLPPK